MEHYVLQRKRLPARQVEDATDNDRVVRRVEMAQHGPRHAPAPTQSRHSQQTVEKLAIQALKDLFQIENLTLRSGNELAAADLADQVRLPPHVAPVQIQPVAMGVEPGHRLPV